MSLSDLRKKVDAIDAKLVKLLNQRASCTREIKKHKRTHGTALYAPDRERKIYTRLCAQNNGPLPDSAIRACFREIMSSSLALERPLRVGYLGPAATFTHLASISRFGTQIDYCPCRTIADVFNEVEKRMVDYGVVPIENSTEGAVRHTLDMFIDSDLKICAEILLSVEHHLLVKNTNDRVKKIYSHPMVFGQCRSWLEEHVPQAEFIEVSSTTKAAELAAKERGSAAIASSLAADTYRLKVVCANIEDSAHNMTRFLVIGVDDVPPTKRDKTSLMFSIKDRVGGLHDMLVPFKKNEINLTNIESRPSRRKAWDYYFYVDLEGHISDAKIAQAVAELEKKCRFLKVLGSYPAGNH